jgi:hypothetical protein
MDEVQARLEKQARWARNAYAKARAARSLDVARDWLRTHPSGRPDVDAAWMQCLEEAGPLAEWLASERPLNAWAGAIPLRCLLSSHPFMDLPPRWTSTAT